MSFQVFIANITELIGVLGLTMLIGISPRIKAVPPVGFKYPQREGKISLSLATVLIIFSGLVHLFGNRVIPSQTWVPPELSPLVVQTIQAAAAGLLVLILLWRRGQPLKSTGWHPLLARISIQFGIAVMFLTVFLQGKLFVILDGVDSSLWMAFLLLLITSISEETVFRGYLQMRFSSLWNPTTAWLVTAGLFVLWQLPGVLPKLDFANGAVYILILLILRALLVGWMMLKTRHVFAPAIYRALSAWLMMI